MSHVDFKMVNLAEVQGMHAGGVQCSGGGDGPSVPGPSALLVQLRRAAESPHLRGGRHITSSLHFRALRPHPDDRHAVRSQPLCQKKLLSLGLQR